MRKEYFKKEYFRSMILVTGGTGLVGAHLLLSLVQRAEKVRALHRATSDLSTVKKLFLKSSSNGEALFGKIEWAEANLNDLPALADAFEGINHVYHCAAYISFNPKHYRKLKKSNVEGTANIVNLCLMNKVKKLCYVSSVATLGKAENGALIDEETTWNPELNNNVYAISKYGAELQVWRASQEGLQTVMVSPGVILGEGRWNTGSGLIIKTTSKGIPFYTPGGFGIVDVKDVVSAMLQLMEGPYANSNYLLVGKNISTFELLGELSRLFHKKPPTRTLPKWLFSIFRLGDGLSNLLFGTKRKLFKSTVNSLYKTSYYDGSKIERELKFEYTPYLTTLKRVAENYKLNA